MRGGRTESYRERQAPYGGGARRRSSASHTQSQQADRVRYASSTISEHEVTTMRAFALVLLALSDAAALRVPPPRMMADAAALSVKTEIPPRGMCGVKFKPLASPSEAVVVKYSIPFGLNVEQQNGLAVCTKAGEGGEAVGDILRYCTEWKIGLPPGDGALTTAASFGGIVSWQMGLFDVAKAGSWDAVVEALTSNTEDRTDTVTLIFERPKQVAEI